jgi:hypothetical protein
MKEITEKKAEEIIDNRVPLGKFWCREGDAFIGIDNESGDAWTEQFDNLDECKKWLFMKYKERIIFYAY